MLQLPPQRQQEEVHRLPVELEVPHERAVEQGADGHAQALGGQAHLPPPGVEADLEFLQKLASAVQEQCRKAPVKTVIHEDLPLPVRVLRDLVTSDVERILVDSEPDFHQMKSFTAAFLPEIEPMLELYTRQRPIFDLHGIEDEIKKALDRL